MLQGLIYGWVTAYLISTTAFLFWSIFFRTVRARSTYFLNRANELLLPALFVNMFFWVKDTALPFFSSMGANNGPVIHIRNVYSYLYLLSTPVLGFLFQLLFLKKSFRPKKWATIVSLVLVCLLVNLEQIIIIITRGYQDHLPGRWTYYSASTEGQLSIVALAAVYFMLCWLATRNKTGQPTH